MNKKIFFIVGILTLLSGCRSGKIEPIEMTLFYSEHCSACYEVREVFLPRILREHGAAIDLRELNADLDENLTALRQIVRAFDRDQVFVPSILIDGYFLVGKNEVTKELRPIIRQIVRDRAGKLLSAE